MANARAGAAARAAVLQQQKLWAVAAELVVQLAKSWAQQAAARWYDHRVQPAAGQGARPRPRPRRGDAPPRERSARGTPWLSGSPTSRRQKERKKSLQIDVSGAREQTISNPFTMPNPNPGWVGIPIPTLASSSHASSHASSASSSNSPMVPALCNVSTPRCARRSRACARASRAL